MRKGGSMTSPTDLTIGDLKDKLKIPRGDEGTRDALLELMKLRAAVAQITVALSDPQYDWDEFGQLVEAILSGLTK